MREDPYRIPDEDREYRSENGHRPLSDEERDRLERKLENHPDTLGRVLRGYGVEPSSRPRHGIGSMTPRQSAAGANTVKPAPDKPKFQVGPDNPFWTMDRDRRDRILDQMSGKTVEDVADAISAVESGEAWDPENDERVDLAAVGLKMAENAVAYRDATSRDGVSDRAHIDTGRYLRVEFRSKPGEQLDVYESAPVGNIHEFWDMDSRKGVTQVTCCEMKDVRILGVYEGRPFQAKRDEYQAVFDKNMSKASPMGKLNRLAYEIDSSGSPDENLGPEY